MTVTNTTYFVELKKPIISWDLEKEIKRKHGDFAFNLCQLLMTKQIIQDETELQKRLVLGDFDDLKQTETVEYEKKPFLGVGRDL